MKPLFSILAFAGALVLLTSCSEDHAAIDGSSEEAFINSSTNLRKPLSVEQKEIFDKGLALMQREVSREDIDGKGVEDVMEVEFERLRGFRETRVEKRQSFQGMAEKFKAQGSDVPANIIQTLTEVTERIAVIDAKLALANSRDGSGRENEKE